MYLSLNYPAVVPHFPFSTFLYVLTARFYAMIMIYPCRLRQFFQTVTLRVGSRPPDKAGMTKSKVRRIEKARAKRNGIIIIQRIDIKTLLKMGRDC